jgi:hypothetical protein
VARYSPIVVGASVAGGAYANEQKVDLHGDLIAYTYHEGGLIFRGLWIENTGWLPITITGVEQNAPGWVGLTTTVSPRLGEEAALRTWRPLNRSSRSRSPAGSSDCST